MRRRFLTTLALIIVWMFVVAGFVFAEAYWFAQPSVTRGDFASIQNHMVQILRDAAEARQLGSAALVLIHKGKIAAEHGFAAANARTNAPVKPDETLFLVASVSKAVTAWGVMRLVDEGKLSLDEPVRRHLKRWQFSGSEAFRDRVTVRHLLSHTAGLDDGLGYAGFGPGEQVQTLEESLSLTKDSSVGPPRPVLVAREPGAAFAYSGGGYTILQLLIEEVTGRPFARYMKEAVLQPLGMTKSEFDFDTLVAEGHEKAIAPNFDGGLNVHRPRRYTAQAAVSLHATARDLAQFLLAFVHENPVLKPGTLKQMMEPQPHAGDGWGLGQTLYARNDAGGYVVGHSGGTGPAWGAMVRINPATGNGFVLTVSGAQSAANLLPHDWLYWETGVVTSTARLQVVQNRLRHALLAMGIGSGVILLWRLKR